MSYLQQILGSAQERGGLTDDEFNSIFQQFMPQQQPQANMGLPQQQMPQQVQRPQGIQQTQMPMQWGTGLNTTQFSKGKPNGVEGDDSVGLMDRAVTAYKYDTDLMSDTTKALTLEDRGLNEDEGFGEMFSRIFGQ